MGVSGLQVAGEEEWCIGGDFNMIESFNDTTATPQFYKEGNVSRGRSYAFTLTYMMFDIQTTFNAKLILFYSPN